ncbi:hypothetical protein CR513_34815, partial [Mucuna pruriens]
MTTQTRVFSSVRTFKVRPWGRCSNYIRQQRTRLYIIWRCTRVYIENKSMMLSSSDSDCKLHRPQAPLSLILVLTSFPPPLFAF